MMRLINADCLEAMRDIPDGSVDMVLTDPPYGTTACKWDSVIPFAPMWEQLKRITKPNGAIVLFGSEPFSSALRISNMNQFRYDWIWDKKNSANYAMAKNMPLKCFEIASVFSSGSCGNGSKEKMPYFPQGLVEINKPVIKVEGGKGDRHRPNRTYNRTLTVQTHTNYPKAIVTFGTTSKLHPTQKPVALMEYLIRTYTNAGDTVLDFTMGSGTTGVAAKTLGRSFIGIELDPDYFALGSKRIADTPEFAA
jgi:site-specific DNA-methyltransferase (adenine-specific)